MKHFLLMESNDGTVTSFDGYVENWKEAEQVVLAFVEMLNSDGKNAYYAEEYPFNGVFVISEDCQEKYSVYVGVIPEVKKQLNSVSWTGFDYTINAYVVTKSTNDQVA